MNHRCFFVSDLHGRRRRYLKLFERIAEERPAALFMGGDLLPMPLDLSWAGEDGGADFVRDFLAPGFESLRERLGDLELYARFFLKRLAPRTGRRVRDLTPAALESLRRHAWPGNVRELENVLERAMVLSSGDLLDRGDLPVLSRPVAAASGERLFLLPEDGISLEALEKDLLQQAMVRADGNKSAAARLLGLTRRTLGYRLEKHGLAGDEPSEGGR